VRKKDSSGCPLEPHVISKKVGEDISNQNVAGRKGKLILDEPPADGSPCRDGFPSILPGKKEESLSIPQSLTRLV